MVLQILRIALFLGLGAVPALACTKPQGPDALIRQSAINQDLLERAILAEVNYYRCKANRHALVLAPDKLNKVAHGHSNWMAGTGKMSHTGGKSTGRTLSDRVRRSGLSARTYAENLAFLPRYRFGGKPFRVKDRQGCRFQLADGREVGPHTYRSLARSVVKMWMESPGHRRNLLSRDQKQMSAAATIAPDKYCGRLYVTQMFLG